MLLSALAVVKYLLLFAFFLVLGVLGFIMVSFRNIVPFVPTPKKVVRKMVEAADARPGEKICDLGSGSGRIIFQAAKEYKNNLVFGFETSFLLRMFSKSLLLFHPLIKKRIQIVNRDFFNINLADFDVIFCFLTPEALRILSPKFQTLLPGTRIITYMFHLENQQGLSEIIDNYSAKDIIYYYKKIS
ncbi:MAG: class I SAM-dependent methyltransferase [Candidatus Parcubacteria bacterium]|nr:class I SAM-dependent methyltransferase [Candidatus Parcubacteria bacterium]